MTAANQAAGRSSTLMFSKAVTLTLLLSGGGVLILSLFPEFIMGGLFSDAWAI